MTTLQVYEVLAVIYKNFGNPLSVDDIMGLMKGVSKRQLSCALKMLSYENTSKVFCFVKRCPQEIPMLSEKILKSR